MKMSKLFLSKITQSTELMGFFNWKGIFQSTYSKGMFKLLLEAY